MTREEAKNIVKGITDKIEATTDIDDWAEFWGFTREDYEDFLEMSIKALEQEPCEDAVSRRAAIEIARSNIHYGLDKEYECSRELLEKTIAEINSLPPVTPTRPNAHNNNEDYAECDQFVCSNCGIELQDWHRVERDEDDGEVSYHEYTFKFCPNCGAETESGDKE